MGLKDYVVPTTAITLAPGNTMPVRGLNFSDLTKLMNTHGPALILIYGRVWAEMQAGALDGKRVGELIQTTLAETPLLIADIIAMAADEPDMAPNAAKLNPMVQLEAIMRIIEHTFISEAEVKKLVETVTVALEKVSGLANTLTNDQASTAGSGGSGDA